MTQPIVFTPKSRGTPRATPKGRQPTDEDRRAVAAAVGGLAPRRDLLIEHLHRLQDRYGGLRRGQLAALAEHLRLSMAEVHETASFYHHFLIVDDDAVLAPVTLRVCTSLACAMAGAEALLADARTLDGEDVRVEAVPCIGRCHQAPAACVGQHAVGHATLDRLDAMVQGGAVAPRRPEVIGFEAYRDAGGYGLFERCRSGAETPEAIIAAVEAAGLRGLGGAGFPTARKWKTVAAQPAPRSMVVNVDEGEVGTFKDHAVLASDPHRALEGMLVAAWAVGVSRIWIYLRDEYHELRAMLEDELAAIGAAFGRALPAIELRRGAGAYICGEESALIESVEGKRGWPRLKPPIVAQTGVFGRPTLAQNVETLWWIRDIVERGPQWYAGAGRRGRSGWRRFSVSGRVQRPGVYVAPAGITARELIDEHAGGMLPGHRLYAYLPGGASGGILPAALADLPLDFDTLASYGCFVGSMAVIVLSEADKARDAALSMMRFFADESCGQCTPCRAGTAKAVELLQAPVWDRALLEDLSQVMRDASICGLGQAAPNPVDSVLRFFPHEVEGRS